MLYLGCFPKVKTGRAGSGILKKNGLFCLKVYIPIGHNITLFILFSFGSINFHIYHLLPAPVLLYIPMVFLNFASTSFYDSSDKLIPLINLQENGLGSSSVKPRNKRSYDHGHSKDLALVLAKNYVSSSILNKLDKNSTFSTTLSI